MKRVRDDDMADNLITNYIDGRFQPSVSGSYLDVVSPSTGEVVGKVNLSTAEVKQRSCVLQSGRACASAGSQRGLVESALATCCVADGGVPLGLALPR